MFLKILPQESRYSAFCKPDFTDIETAIAFGDTIVDSEVNLEKYKISPLDRLSNKHRGGERSGLCVCLDCTICRIARLGIY